ncbi:MULTISPECIES: AAA family ATPase [unclassified Lentimonas]|uniref:AAA family ATPase n=1 Tax=unclassified Lentimonas TaxID=2630993 RepID=UPI00132AC07C|nr:MULTISPECIES: ATP-dependent Clp protease ATP-binding subunit [unclassified Lentimonas]CAA6692354.1 Unannotated [Lentimonas sp. CC10]CAA6694691.1 Unannotated [Lentimonas sp. CC19]CAA7071436.1 Unannotated [Lentimonas sp. CC11]
MLNFDPYAPLALELLETAAECARRRKGVELTLFDLTAAILEKCTEAPYVTFFEDNEWGQVADVRDEFLTEVYPDLLPKNNVKVKARPLELSEDAANLLAQAEAESCDNEDGIELIELMMTLWPAVGDPILTRINCIPETEIDVNYTALAPGALLLREDYEEVSTAEIAALQNLTLLCELGTEMNLVPSPYEIVGREKEIASLEAAMLKYFKPNPLIIGEAGVGKTAVVEALADRIHRGTCSEDLREARIFEIRVSDLLAGTTYRGELEERLKNLLREAESNPDVILFFDEIHTLLQQDNQSTKIADVFKPALARGKIRLIGATTRKEYQNYITKDEAIERRFEVIHVGEPSKAATLAILKAIGRKLAEHHGVSIEDELLQHTIDAADEFLINRNFPDKAIDLLDRAMTSARYADRDAVDAEWIRQSAQRLTGVSLNETLNSRLKSLSAALHNAIIGQDAAIDAIVQSVCLSKKRLDIRSNRPDGVFMFNGPSGVGKSSMAAALAVHLTGNATGLFTISMADFAEESAAARLIGVPSGYAGSEDESLLTKAATRSPNGVLLLEEFEKAHPCLHRVFLEIFKTGRFTDASGSSYSFANVTIIATTNLHGGSKAKLGFHNSIVAPTKQHGSLHHDFPPELLARFDEIITFNPLTRELAKQILNKSILTLGQSKFGNRREAHLTQEEEDAILDMGFSETSGVRHLIRAFERIILLPLALAD